MVDTVLQSPTNPHFFQPLLPNFYSHLSIPVKFFKLYLEGRYEGKSVELISDACESTWKVKMDGLRLTVGWNDFATAHDFRIGDVVVFRHQGDLVFHVTGFGPSFCEIQYVQSSNNEDGCDDDEGEIRNLSMKQIVKTEQRLSQDEDDNDDDDDDDDDGDDDDDDEDYDYDDDDDEDNIGNLSRNKQGKKRKTEAEAEPCFDAHVTESNLRVDTLFLPKEFIRSYGLNQVSKTISIVNERGMRTWTLRLKFRQSSRRFYMRGGWSIFCHENGLEPGDSITFKLDTSDTKTPLLRFYGESRQRVSSSLNEDPFVKLTATPASLKDCRLYLPKSFTGVHKFGNEGGKKITLLDKHGVEWPVTLLIEKRNGKMSLGSGLKEFFKAIDIKAYESFVLELVWRDVTTPMFKVCSRKT